MRKLGYSLAAAIPLGLLGWMMTRAPGTSLAPAPAPSASSAQPQVHTDGPDDNHDDDRSYVFRIPSGEPTALSCDEARTIIEQVRAGLAYVPEPVQAGPFATSAADWLDPHGLLSLAKDAPTTRSLTKIAPDLVADIEGRRQRSCAAANAPAAVLEIWVGELRDAFDTGRRAAARVDAKRAARDPSPPTGAAR
jgi:carboxyl-terminal processing protease